MRKVIDAIKRAGVAARDVQTSSVSLSPRYSQNGEDIVGYTASNTVNATIRSISRSGAVIDAAVGAGANQVYGPSFTRSDETVLYRRALCGGRCERTRQGTDARGRRQGAARARCARSSSPRSGPIPLAEKAAAADAGTPIEPGTQRVEASVTVEFGFARRRPAPRAATTRTRGGPPGPPRPSPPPASRRRRRRRSRAAARAWSGVEMPKPR